MKPRNASEALMLALRFPFADGCGSLYRSQAALPVAEGGLLLSVQAEPHEQQGIPLPEFPVEVKSKILPAENFVPCFPAGPGRVFRRENN
jgi:hypothetical protein